MMVSVEMDTGSSSDDQMSFVASTSAAVICDVPFLISP